MRTLIFASATALMLAACGGASDTNMTNDMTTDMNSGTMTVDNGMMGSDMNAADPMAGNMDANMGGNMADPNSQNMMNQDMNTNDPDTNLANGM